MAIGPSHYSRDWKLLNQVSLEWAAIRNIFGLGSKATRKQIEEKWDEIFNTNPSNWPAIRRLFKEIFSDEDLIRDLRKYYYRNLRPWEWKEYDFEDDIKAAVLSRIVWIVVRNAHKWLKLKGTAPHWALFWNEENLTEELRRAIKETDENERDQFRPLGLADGDQDGGQAPGQDYRRQRPEAPEDAAALFEKVDRCCSATDAKIYKDWYLNCENVSETEIAKRNGLKNTDELDAVIRRVNDQLRRFGR